MKIFVVTQAMDATHPILSFFVEWVRTMHKHPTVSSVHVACLDHASDTLEDVAIHRLSSRKRIPRILEMWKLLISTDWDVLFVHMTPIWCIVCWPIVFLKRKKMTLWYAHGSTSFSLRLACLLSDEVYTSVMEVFPLRIKNCFEVGQGIPRVFSEVSRAEACLHAYLSVGRISVRKRVIETLELFARIHAMDPLSKFTWVGSGIGNEAYQIEVRNAVERLGLQSCVTFLGPVPYAQTPALFAAHDCLLHLSGTGSLDKVAIEALITGCSLFSLNPAVGEALGRHWMWRGELNDEAAQEAIRRANAGVPSIERTQVAERYALETFIDRICLMMGELIR
jgi:hypothetical protein